MTEEFTSDPVDFAMRRLASAVNPPDVQDAKQFKAEFRTALKDLPKEALIEGVTTVIRNRKAKSFPSIGEVRAAAEEQLPKAKAAMYGDMSREYRADDSRREEAFKALVRWPDLKWLINTGVHVRVYEYLVEHGDYPSKKDFESMLEDFYRREPDIQNPPNLVRSAAEAIKYRRTELAKRLQPYIRKEAAR